MLCPWSFIVLTIQYTQYPKCKPGLIFGKIFELVYRGDNTRDFTV